MFHAVHSLVFWITIGGVLLAFIGYIALPKIPAVLARIFSWPYRALVAKYGFDLLNDLVFVRGSKALGRFFYRVGDQTFIDGFFVNGTARTVDWFALKGRAIQSGYLYHYVAVMVFGLFGFLCWLLLA